MNNWRSLPSKGGLIGIGFTLLSAIACGLMLAVTLLNAFAAASSGANPGTFYLGLAAFVSLLITIFLGWRTWRFFQLRYYLDRNFITIDLGDSRQIIPLVNIQQVTTAESLLEVLKGQIATEKETTVSDAPSQIDPEPPRLTVSNTGSGFDDEFFSQSQPRSTETTVAKAKPKIVTSVEDAADSSFDEALEVVSAEPETGQVKVAAPDEVESTDEIIEGEVIEASFLEDAIQNENSLAEPNSTEETVTTTVEGEVISEVNQATIASRVADKNKQTEPKVASVKIPALSVKMEGWRWPGYYLNRGYFPAMGQIQFFSTASFGRTILIRTYNITYAISPNEPQRFLTELRLRRNLGATEELEEGIKPGPILAHPLWHDWVGRTLIFLGLLCNLALFLYMLWNFNYLPQNVQIHFNKFGDPDRIGPIGDLMWLPFVGLIAVVVNSVLGAWLQVRDKVPAYLLYIATIVMQFLIALALAGILAGGGNSG